MASNKELDAMRHRISDDSFFRTGTYVVYENVGTPFGETVQYDGLTYNVPKEYQGNPRMINKMFVFEHRNGVTIDEKGVFTGEVIAILNRPVKDGWYEIDPDTAIPTGKECVPNDPIARYWYGSSKHGGVFAIVRGTELWGIMTLWPHLRTDVAWSDCGAAEAETGQRPVSIPAPPDIKTLLRNAEISLGELARTTRPAVLGPLRELIEMVRGLDKKE
jgi:hypothetical protein